MNTTKRLAVIGAGIMGHGIAQVGAMAGLEVQLVDVEAKALDRARQGGAEQAEVTASLQGGLNVTARLGEVGIGSGHDVVAYDDASGTVDFTPWLMAASDCITTPPTNTPPFAPKSPNPVNGAVRVPAIDGIVTVSWLGGDPNPWDTVTYDVYFGDAAGTLGDHHKVDNHQNREHHQTDGVVAAYHEFTEGLDHLTGRVGTGMTFQ